MKHLPRWSSPARVLTLLVLLVAAAACKKAPDEPMQREEAAAADEARQKSQAAASAVASDADRASRRLKERVELLKNERVRPGLRPRGEVGAKPVAQVRVSPDDPLKGVFSLEQAFAGLSGSAAPIAEIHTKQGKLECELFEDKAPITVANFVGLARGLRPFKDPSGSWVKKPAYDGTVFHRIVKGFMIQGGDSEGTGKGEPGYVIPDEIWEGAKHDGRGYLCMANRGPNTNGQQFFITDGAAPHLDGGYTIFGKCQPDAVIEKLASSEVLGDRATDPPKIEKIVIRR